MISIIEHFGIHRIPVGMAIRCFRSSICHILYGFSVLALACFVSRYLTSFTVYEYYYIGFVFLSLCVYTFRPFLRLHSFLASFLAVLSLSRLAPLSIEPQLLCSFQKIVLLTSRCFLRNNILSLVFFLFRCIRFFSAPAYALFRTLCICIFGFRTACIPILLVLFLSCTMGISFVP